MKLKILLGLILISGWESTSGQTIRKDFDRFGDETTKEHSIYFSIGKKNHFGDLIDSVYSWYSQTGKLKSIEFRDRRGKAVGNFKTFYPNGRIKAVGRFEHKSFKVYKSSADSVEQLFLEFYDSSGRYQVRNGKGMIDGPVDMLRERGPIVRGVRDSVWTAWYPNGKIFYQESWHEGELVDGVSYPPAGGEIYYDRMFVPAEPREGLSKFYEQVTAQIEYPKEAEQRGIEGKVVVGFTVGKDGAIHTPVILKSIGYGCDEEAIRVLKLSPSWKPASRRGQPVSSRTSITYIFKLT